MCRHERTDLPFLSLLNGQSFSLFMLLNVTSLSSHSQAPRHYSSFLWETLRSWFVLPFLSSVILHLNSSIYT